MSRLRQVYKYVLVFCFIYSGCAYAQVAGYPGFNGGTPTNENPNGPGTYQPTAQSLNILLPNGGGLVTANGLAPGAQVNLTVVQNSASLTADQIQSLSSTLNSNLSQAWPGVPYATYPNVNTQTSSTTPAVDPNTGFTGATTSSVTAVVDVVSQADLVAACTSTAAACTSFTVDPSTGYVTSELTYITPTDTDPEDHEVAGHGLFNLTDTTDSTSAMYYQEGLGPTTLSAGDLQKASSDSKNPAPPQPTCNSCPCSP